MLDINTWDHVCPVLLPLDAPTMSTVFIASMGVLAPFGIFVLAFFIYLHSLWLNNAKVNDDGSAVGGGAVEVRYDTGDGGDDVFVAVGGGGRTFVDATQKRNFSRAGTTYVATRY
jgi:hypothetical protein